jgi:hypothetical protein
VVQAPVLALRAEIPRRALPPASLPPWRGADVALPGGDGRVASCAILPTSLRSMDRPSLLRRLMGDASVPFGASRRDDERAVRDAVKHADESQDDSHARHAICTRDMRVNRIRTRTRAKCASSSCTSFCVACASRFSSRAMRGARSPRAPRLSSQPRAASGTTTRSATPV